MDAGTHDDGGRLRRRTALGLGLGAAGVALMAVLFERDTSLAPATVEDRLAALFGMRSSLGHTYADLPGAAGRVDVHTPPGSGPFPVLVWNDGSGWRSDRGFQGGRDVARGMVPAGYAVAAFSVRSSSQGTFPAQVLDATAAVRWVRAHAAEFGLDPGRIAVGGNSSGGWNALMAGLTGGRDLDRSRVPFPGSEVPAGGHAIPPEDAVQAIVECAAPVDFLQMNVQMPRGACAALNRRQRLEHCHLDEASTKSRMLGAPVMARPELARLARPEVHVTPDSPPTLLIHGRDDHEVPYLQSRGLYSVFAERGLPTALYSVAGAGHDLGMMTRRLGPTDVLRAHLPRTAVHATVSWAAVAAFLDAVMPG